MNKASKHLGTVLLLSAIALSFVAPHQRVEASTITDWTIPTAGSNPFLDIFVSSGLVYFTEYQGNKIGRLNPATGVFTEWTIPTAVSCPYGIFVSGGLVYFAEALKAKIGRLDAGTGIFTEWTIPTAGSYPQGISVSGGLVYFTECQGNKIGRLDPATGIFTEWTIPTPNSCPYRIFVSGGLVYFTEYTWWSNKIGRLDPATGVFTEWTVPTANAHPNDIAVSGGLVYFTEEYGNKIGRLDPATGVFTEWTVPTADSRPLGISVSSGLVYFTEYQGNKIGRLDPVTGIFAEWTIPPVGGQPYGIAAFGSLVYFTELSLNKIGCLSVAAAATVTTSVAKTFSAVTTAAFLSTASTTFLSSVTTSSSTRSTAAVSVSTTSFSTSVSDTLTVEPLLAGRGLTWIGGLSCSPTPGIINQATTISGYLYGSWNSIVGVVVGVPVEVTITWGYRAIVVTGSDGRFTVNTNCPARGGMYDVIANFNGDTYLMGSSGTTSYQVIEYIETTLSLTHRYESSGMGGARRFYGYLKEKVSGLPVPSKTVRLTIYSGGYAYIFDVTTNSLGYYDYLFTTNGGIFTWAEARFAGSGLYLASFSGRIYP